MLTLLFVHIGTKYPNYLITNIERTRSLFPDKKIVLLGDTQPRKSWLINHKIEFIEFKKNLSFEDIFTYGKFEANFRSGYWRHTIERLLGIEAYHQEYPQEKVLHVESDVILFPNFPFEYFNSLNGISWMNYSDKGDIASLIYSPCYESSQIFSKHIIHVFSSFGGSDMDVLFKIRGLFKEYKLLPTFNEKLSNFANSYREPLSVEHQGGSNGIIPGIFDALGIGMWIAGMDPRNRFGFTRIHTRELIDSGVIEIDPSKMSFSISSEGNIFIESGDHVIPIYNLHIHSKNKILLSIKWERELRKLVKKNSIDATIINFSAVILANLILTNIKNRNFIPFILQIPMLRKIRAKASTKSSQ